MAAFLEQFSRVVTDAGIVQGLFMALLLNSQPARASRANLFLSVLLLAMSFSVLHMKFAGEVISHFSLTVYRLGDPTFFLIAPLLWLYIQALTGHSFRWSARLVLHFVPFLGLIVCSVALRKFFPDNWLIAETMAQPRAVAIVFWGLVIGQFVGYLWLVNRRWRAYQQLIEQEVSNTENVSFAWVRFFMGVFLGITLLFLFILINLIHRGPFNELGRLIATIFSLSIFALGYKGILQKEVVNTVRPAESATPLTPTSDTQERKVDQQLIDRLLRFMDEEKPYLDPELTLSSLAKRLQISRSQLSQLINEGVGDNFYNFVNKYRVEQVKVFMGNPAMNHYTLLGLALDAGFKSKSTFNLIFKRFTGLTPTEYGQTLSNE